MRLSEIEFQVKFIQHFVHCQKQKNTVKNVSCPNGHIRFSNVFQFQTNQINFLSVWLTADHSLDKWQDLSPLTVCLRLGFPLTHILKAWFVYLPSLLNLLTFLFSCLVWFILAMWEAKEKHSTKLSWEFWDIQIYHLTPFLNSKRLEDLSDLLGFNLVMYKRAGAQLSRWQWDVAVLACMKHGKSHHRAVGTK